MILEPIEVAMKFEGFTLEEAEKIAEAHNWLIRVVCRDGESFVITTDYIFRRINVEVKGDIIMKVLNIG